MKTYVFGVVRLFGVAHDKWLVEEVTRRCESAAAAMDEMRVWNLAGGGIAGFVKKVSGSRSVHAYWLKRVDEDGLA